MRDARQISAREVSQGVQRHVLDQTTGFGSTVRTHSGPAPLISGASTVIREQTRDAINRAMARD